MKKIREEEDYKTAVTHFRDDPNIKIEFWHKGFDQLRVIVTGIPNTPYEGGKFIFEIKFPVKYPFEPPYVYCHTLIWHPNIDNAIPPGNLNVCLHKAKCTGTTLDLLLEKSGWDPNMTLSTVISALKDLIYCREPSFCPTCAVNSEAGNQWVNDRAKFENKALEWVRKYAMQ